MQQLHGCDDFETLISVISRAAARQAVHEHQMRLDAVFKKYTFGYVRGPAVQTQPTTPQPASQQPKRRQRRPPKPPTTTTKDDRRPSREQHQRC